MKIITLSQGSQAWLDWRSAIGEEDHYPAVTATTAANIGGNGYESAKIMFDEYLGLRPPKEVNFAMERGSMLEPLARRASEAALDDMFVPQCIQSTKTPWIRASLDGLDMFGARGLETKCPMSSKLWDAICEGRLLKDFAPHYYDQVQWQLLASDNSIETIEFSVYDEPSDSVQTTTVRPDIERQKVLLHWVSEWRKQVIAKQYTFKRAYYKQEPVFNQALEEWR